MPQQPSINDNEVDLWRKLVINTGGISPTPPQSGFLLLNSGDFVLLNSGDRIAITFNG